jgi:nitroreductase
LANNDAAVLEALRKVRQTRAFTDEPVTDGELDQLLEVARWTGSSRNTQPWRFIVIRDPELLKKVSSVRDAIAWAAGASLAIAIVIEPEGEISGAFDEGRVTERLMIAAHLLGLGGGTAWYGDEDQQAAAKALLGIPPHLTARSMVAIGHVDSTAKRRTGRGGRKPISELVTYDRMT